MIIVSGIIGIVIGLIMGLLVHKLFKKAKEMEKQQIIDAWKSGDITGRIGILKTKDEYYNETYEI